MGFWCGMLPRPPILRKMFGVLKGLLTGCDMIGNQDSTPAFTFNKLSDGDFSGLPGVYQIQPWIDIRKELSKSLVIDNFGTFPPS
jgi:hypothetical protein